MTGQMEHCEGTVEAVASLELAIRFYNVIGLQAILERFAGKRVSIVVEELEDQ